MAEADIIKESYEALVDQVFNAYWNNAFIGNPSANQIQQAETSFKNEILAARKARRPRHCLTAALVLFR